MATFGQVRSIEYDILVYIYSQSSQTPMATLTADDIQSYSSDDNANSNGIALGTAISKSFSMSFLNAKTGRYFTPAQLDGARVVAKLYDSRVSTCVHSNVSTWLPFGEWYIDHTVNSEQNLFCDVSGTDALASKFGAKFTDSLTYPQTLFSLLNSFVPALSRHQIATPTFHNYNFSLSTKPKWTEETTARDVVAFVAFVAGGFARINYSGELEILTVGTATQHFINSYHYREFTGIGGTKFAFNCLEYKFENQETYTRYAVDSTITSNASNTVQYEGNVLVTAAICNDVVQQLEGIEYEGASLEWFGSPLIQAGDTATITDTHNVLHTIFVTGHNIEFDGGGLSAALESSMPSVNDTTASYSNGASAFNPDGSLNVEAVSGLPNKVYSLTDAYIQHLTAQDIITNTLIAKVIDAVRIIAQSIEATDVTTNTLTAAFADIVQATIRKLNAETITTDVLYAGLAEITALKVNSLTATDIVTDALAAALAKFNVITAGNASFDFATIQNLVASVFRVERAIGDNVFIKNLTATYANMVRADVADLNIKAADGNYYKLVVGTDGSVTAQITELTPEEIEQGEDEDGNPIVPTTLPVEQLRADDPNSLYLLIERLDASRIDTETLWARQAFIDKLMTSDITANQSLSIKLASMVDATDNAQGIANLANDATTEMNRFITFNILEGMRQRKPNSIYSTLIDDVGFHVDKDDAVGHVVSLDGDNGLNTHGVKIGNIKAKATSTGGWAFQEV